MPVEEIIDNNQPKSKKTNETKEVGNIQVRRVLSNDLSILVGRSNEAKSSYLCHLISQYKANYNGDIYVFGFQPELVEKLGVKTFNSLPEMENISGAILIIDEVKSLIDISDRRNRTIIEKIFRTINHKGNKLLLSGLPSDFPKYICAKVKVFMYKSLAISDLINGTKVKEHLLDYKGVERGMYTLDIPINEVLCFDGQYWKESMAYNKEFDTKRDLKDLFVSKKTSR